MNGEYKLIEYVVFLSVHDVGNKCLTDIIAYHCNDSLKYFNDPTNTAFYQIKPQHSMELFQEDCWNPSLCSPCETPGCSADACGECGDGRIRVGFSGQVGANIKAKSVDKAWLYEWVCP